MTVDGLVVPTVCDCGKRDAPAAAPPMPAAPPTRAAATMMPTTLPAPIRPDGWPCEPWSVAAPCAVAVAVWCGVVAACCGAAAGVDAAAGAGAADCVGVDAGAGAADPSAGVVAAASAAGCAGTGGRCGSSPAEPCGSFEVGTFSLISASFFPRHPQHDAESCVLRMAGPRSSS